MITRWGQSGEGQKRKVRNNQKTEILFLERIWQFLKPGTGRAAIVLPDGILTNASLQYVRDFLLAKYQILAVVSFPQFAFAHFGAGVKSSIIFVRKRGVNEKPSDDEAIFMAAPETIGYDATGRETANALPDIIRQYEAFTKDPSPFFRVSPGSTTFAVRRGELLMRVDVYANLPRFRDLFESLRRLSFPAKTLREIATLIFSGTTPTAGGNAYTDSSEGIPFVRSGEITPDGYVEATQEIFLNLSIHKVNMFRSQLHKGDLLIAIVGATIGAVGLYDREGEANINQAIAGVRLDHKTGTPRICARLLDDKSRAKAFLITSNDLSLEPISIWTKSGTSLYHSHPSQFSATLLTPCKPPASAAPRNWKPPTLNWRELMAFC